MFNKILSNRIFCFIFILTVGLQIILVEFGGKVFKVDPAGLDATGWIISILCGAGSLLVGLLVRVLPPYYIPHFLYTDYTTSEMQVAHGTAFEINMIRDKLPMSAHNKELWDQAIKKTKLQVRVVKAFQRPGTEGDSSKVAGAPAPTSYVSPWERVRQAISSDRFPRRSNDISNIMVVDPRALYAARVRFAKGHHGR